MFVNVLKDITDLINSSIVLLFYSDLFLRYCIITFKELFVFSLSEESLIHLRIHDFEVFKYLDLVLLILICDKTAVVIFIVNKSLLVSENGFNWSWTCS